MSNTILDVYKDALNQDILEGECCLWVNGKSISFGVVVESRVKVKVAAAHPEVKYMSGVYVKTGNLVVRESWVCRDQVSMVQEEWLYSILDADTLQKMATIKMSVAEQVSKVKARKERKKLKLKSEGQF